MNTQTHNVHVCPASHSAYLDNFIRRLFQNPTKIVKDYIKPGDTVIDIGCGPGFFSIDMARLVGDTGRVYSVDLQSEMLEKVERKARKLNLADRIVLHQCARDRVNLNHLQADFILAYYMVHETPDHNEFFAQVKTLLKPGGLFLVVEPVFHVSKGHFKTIISDAENTGFKLKDTPKKRAAEPCC